MHVSVHSLVIRPYNGPFHHCGDSWVALVFPAKRAAIDHPNLQKISLQKSWGWSYDEVDVCKSN